MTGWRIEHSGGAPPTNDDCDTWRQYVFSACGGEAECRRRYLDDGDAWHAMASHELAVLARDSAWYDVPESWVLVPPWSAEVSP